MTHFTESILEQATIEYFSSLRFHISYGLEIAPGELDAFRQSYHQVLLDNKLHDSLARINPTLPDEAIEDAFRKLVNLPLLHPGLIANNQAFYKYLTDGIDIEYRSPDGCIVGDKAWLVDTVARKKEGETCGPPLKPSCVRSNIPSRQ